jgi:hypothetical protein
MELLLFRGSLKKENRTSSERVLSEVGRLSEKESDDLSKIGRLVRTSELRLFWGGASTIIPLTRSLNKNSPEWLFLFYIQKLTIKLVYNILIYSLNLEN